jgi:hypothetical protein
MNERLHCHLCQFPENPISLRFMLEQQQRFDRTVSVETDHFQCPYFPLFDRWDEKSLPTICANGFETQIMTGKTAHHVFL